jgi:hypothetical protein
MSGKKTQLTPLETRKQLLLVESELNRVQLINELRELKSEVRHWKHQVEAVVSMASLVVKLATTFSAIGRVFSHRDKDDKPPSWISTLLKSLQTGTSLWQTLRSNRR